MRSGIVLIAVASLLGFADGARAAVLASPAIYGSISQHAARCVIGNTGPTPVAVTVRIFDESGNVVPASSSCNGPIEPNFVCSVSANNIASGVAYACNAEVPGSGARIRGSLTLTDSNELPLRTADLR
jgi:hypothetical protein